MTFQEWWPDIIWLGVVGMFLFLGLKGGPLVCGAVIVGARLALDALAPVVALICAHSYLVDQWGYVLGILGLLLYLYRLDWRARRRSPD